MISLNKQSNNLKNNKCKRKNISSKSLILIFCFSDEQIEQVAVEKTKRLAKRLLNETENTTTITMQDDERDDEKWDCESILTTYSNTYNHPKLITQIPTNKIRLSKKTGLPLAEKKKKETIVKEEEEPSSEDDDDDHSSSITFERKKGETSEERRARKHAVKDLRRVTSFFFSSLLFISPSGSSNDQKSYKDRFQTRRTKTIKRTSFAYNTSTYAKSSCYLIRYSSE